MKIKKILLVFLIILANALFLNAQRDSLRVFHHYINGCTVGVEVGPGISTLYDRNSHWNPVLAISGGVYFQYNFTRIIFASLGLDYDHKGGKGYGELVDQFNNPVLSIPIYLYYNYVSTTLLVHISPDKKGIFFLSAGAYGNILTRAISEVSAYSYNHYNIPADKENITSSVNSGDIGAVLGVGLNIPLAANFALRVEDRNNMGFIKVFSDGSRTFSSIFLAGFNYSFGKRAK